MKYDTCKMWTWTEEELKEIGIWDFIKKVLEARGRGLAGFGSQKPLYDKLAEAIKLVEKQKQRRA